MKKDKLLKDLAQGNPYKRKQAVIKLGKSNDPTVVSVIVRALNDPHPVVRQSALDSLRNMDCAEAKTIQARIDKKVGSQIAA